MANIPDNCFLPIIDYLVQRENEDSTTSGRDYVTALNEFETTLRWAAEIVKAAGLTEQGETLRRTYPLLDADGDVIRTGSVFDNDLAPLDLRGIDDMWVQDSLWAAANSCELLRLEYLAGHAVDDLMEKVKGK